MTTYNILFDAMKKAVVAPIKSGRYTFETVLRQVSNTQPKGQNRFYVEEVNRHFAIDASAEAIIESEPGIIRLLPTDCHYDAADLIKLALRRDAVEWMQEVATGVNAQVAVKQQALADALVAETALIVDAFVADTLG